MKTKLILLLLSICVCNAESIAQSKLHVGIEIGPKKEHFEYEDPYAIIAKKEYRHTIKGLSIAYELNKNYQIESGIYSTPRADNVNFASSRIRGWGNPDRMLQIPLRINRTVLSLTPRLQLRGIAGISYVYNSRANCPTEECYTGARGSGRKPTTPYVEASKYTLNKHTYLGEIGLSANYALKPKLNLSLAATYNHGFRPITRIYTSYYPDEDNAFQALSYSKGSSTNFLLKLSYQLFDFSKPKNQPDEYFKN
jgi:hypothetical protein